jgi:branched-chain amino acid transport system permease protein
VAGVLIGGLPLLVEAAPWFENVYRVLPGTVGVALGRNPNGIAYAVREGMAPLRRRPALVAGTLVGVGAVVALRLAGTLTGAPFALALVAEVAAGGLAAQFLEARRATATDEPEGVPLEWVGIDRPFTAEEVAALDRFLGLEPEPVGAG